MRKLALGLLILSGASGCVTSGNSGGAIDRLRPDAAAHARALAGDDMAEARETGLTLLARLGALAGW
ncbi:MAG: hypothetical protein Tp118SUR00d2C21406231_25 [Prokaryotic dsDNA virus sp.]|nr:MAG: hypothetical protein Tp125DCM00d2C40298531_44 [Prokaryotic dsDNA virus sp.]QDP53145.1 MAG: hypothetical protein Tp118SUR00d2C21406231_25 [Prokaryotic dsDNA virus sp.]